MQFFYNEKTKNFRTKPLYIFLFCLIFIIIPGIILWIYFGYINYSHYYLVFPAYGHIASGTNTKIINELNEIINSKHINYSLQYACKEILQAVKDQNFSGKLSLENFPNSYISPMICVVIIPYLIYSILLPFIFKLVKIVNYDVITFSFTCAGLFSIIILTGAIPVGKYDNNNFSDISDWIIFARIVISAINIPFFFYVANKIVILSLGISKEENDYYAQLTKETLEVQNKEIMLQEKRSKRKKENKEPMYIELDDTSVKLTNKKKEKK